MHYPLGALVPVDELSDSGGALSAVGRPVDYFDMNREVDPYEIPRSWLSPSPQDDCEDCERAGLVEVTERSDSRFACFGIGGRWKGAFDATGAGREILLIADLVPDELPAVVTHRPG